MYATLMNPFTVELDGGRYAQAMRVVTIDDLPLAADKLEVGGRSALVVVGGASGMSPHETRRLRPVFCDVLAPVAQRLDATVIDGGTDVGVMQLMGSTRGEAGWRFPLIGVLVDDLVSGSSTSEAEAVAPAAVAMAAAAGRRRHGAGLGPPWCIEFPCHALLRAFRRPHPPSITTDYQERPQGEER
jgi:hypothetical protein